MAQPMTIKYAVILGMDGLLDASIVRVRPDLAAPLMWEPDDADGVMGLEPPRLGSALENEIWSKLKGFPSG